MMKNKPPTPMRTNLAFVSSDLHFGHDKMAQIRGYSNGAEFTEAYSKAHNAVIQEHNSVIFLGDVCMSRESLSVIAQLNGAKHLVLGNHDQFTHDEYISAGFKSVNAMLFSGSTGVVLTHYPVHPVYFTHRQAKWVNFHGHLHTEVIPDLRYINCCIEQSLAPRKIETLLKELSPCE